LGLLRRLRSMTQPRAPAATLIRAFAVNPSGLHCSPAMMHTRHRRLLPLATAPLLIALAGCSNPLKTTDADRGLNVGAERLRAVKPMDLSSYRAAPQATGGPDAPKGAAGMTPPPPKDPFAGMEKVGVTLEQVRAWTLTNNLDLKATLVDPTIAAQRLSEEEAKFESVFFANGRWNSLDQPTSSTLSGSQIETANFDAGVRIPLRTGGTATIELPIDRTKTDNQFSTLNPATDADVKFSISQPLLRGGWREANTHSIRLQALESQITQSRTNLEVIRTLANADRAYWRVYAAKRLLEVRQDQYDLARQQLERAERRVKAQVAPEIEVTRAQSGLAERLEAIILAENDLRRQVRELKKTVRVPGVDLDSPTVFEPASPPDPVELKLDAGSLAKAGVENRMEMLELELRLAQDISSIDFARNQALPLFALDYFYNINGLSDNLGGALRQTRGGDFADWGLGARFEVPLGNMAARSRVEQAVLARMQRLATRQARELSIRQEVLDSLDSLNAAWQRILAARQASILAGRTLQAEQKQFEVGNRTSTDVLDAATRLADAQSAEIRALTDYQIAQVDLAFATGTLLGATRVSWEPWDPRKDAPTDNPIAPRPGAAEPQ